MSGRNAVEDSRAAFLLAEAQAALREVQTLETLQRTMATAVWRLFRFADFEFLLASAQGGRVEVELRLAAEGPLHLRRAWPDHGVFLFAPVMEYWLQNQRSLWLDYPHCAVPVPRDHMTRCVRLGIANALVCGSLHWPATRLFCCVLVNVQRAARQQALTMLELLAPQFEHAWRRALHARAPGRDVRHRHATSLTSRQLSVLHWIANGKTNWEIGQIEGLSEDGVKYHVKQLFGKIQVSTRTQAVARMAELSSSTEGAPPPTGN